MDMSAEMTVLTVAEALEQRLEGTTYVAYGYDHERIAPEGFSYWIAGCDNDHGPTTPETYAVTIADALRIANELAQTLGVEAWEVDEFGAKAAS